MTVILDAWTAAVGIALIEPQLRWRTMNHGRVVTVANIAQHADAPIRI